MRVIIGAYRGVELVERALQSLRTFGTGIHEVVVVDDSGRQDVRTRLRSLNHVDRCAWVADQAAGYSAAMQRVVEVAGEDPFVFWEEDFQLTTPTNFELMGAMLKQRPYLAQLALLRGPHFPIEHEHGGVLEGMAARLPDAQIDLVDGIWEQTGTFTCNPAVWATGIAARGWPTGAWSEDRKRDELLAEGFSFGFLPDVRVKHDGQRSGFDY